MIIMNTITAAELREYAACYPIGFYGTKPRDMMKQAADALDALTEQHALELAGISTASIQNTDATIKDRITRDSPFATQAYFDVCAAVDREMALHKERNALQKQRDELSRALSDSVGQCSREAVNNDRLRAQLAAAQAKLAKVREYCSFHKYTEVDCNGHEIPITCECLRCEAKREVLALLEGV
jgi:hypothetical protein